MKLIVLSFAVLVVALTDTFAQAPQRPPERDLAEFLNAVSVEDLRQVGLNRDGQAVRSLTKKMDKQLTAAEVGKKWTLICKSSGEPLVSEDSGIVNLYNEPSASIVRKKGSSVKVHVRISAIVPKDKADLIKPCRAGRSMFVTGTISEIDIYGGLQMGTAGSASGGGNAVMLSITVDVDDIGLTTK